MTVHVLQHAPFEGPAAIADWIAARGHELQLVRLYDGEALPEPFEVDMLVVLGGPMSVHDGLPYQAPEAQLVEACLLAGRPTLGVCLGAQVMAHVLGGTVAPQAVGEYG